MKTINISWKAFFFCIIMILLSCKTKTEQEKFLGLFDNTITKKTQSFPVQSDDMRQPVSLVVYNNKLILYDYGVGDSLFSVYDMETGKHVINFGSVGGGPNEFLNVSDIRYAKNGLFAYDRQAKKVVQMVPEDDSFNQIRYTSINIARDSILKAPFNAFPGDDSYNFVSGIISKNRIAIVDSTGKLITTFGNYPYEKKNVSLSFNAKAFLYQPKMAFNDELERLVIASSEGIQIDFYDLKNINTPKLIKKYHYLKPEYRLDTDGSVIFSKENIAGVIQVEGSSRLCFCLYVDRKFSECFSGEDAYLADKILIFNWNGKPLKVISLEHRYSAMTVNEANQEIILLGKDDKTRDYILSRVNLKEEFTNLDSSL